MYREFPDGSRLQLLPAHGRVLGLFAGKDTENFLWTNPTVGKPWPNPGGDRTWVAPESDFFIPDLKRPMDTAGVQPALDPGHWILRQGKLINRTTLKNYRQNRRVRIEITKSYAPAPNPLRYERDFKAKVAYAGYTQETTLRGAAGIWQLLQLPFGGDMLVRTCRRTKPVVLFGKADLTVSDKLVRYRMKAEGCHKISVRATDLTGRVGYLNGNNLVIRNFFVNPSGEYIDTPWLDEADRGYAFQACNVNIPRLGQFNELEYHVPTGHTDVSQVWAFRGTRTAIRAVAERLLGL